MVGSGVVSFPGLPCSGTSSRTFQFFQAICDNIMRLFSTCLKDRDLIFNVISPLIGEYAKWQEGPTAAQKTASAMVITNMQVFSGNAPSTDSHQGVVGMLVSKSVPLYCPLLRNGSEYFSTNSGSKYCPCPPS